MTEPQPEYVWAFPPDEKPNRRRLWLIVGLAVAAVSIAAALFFLFFPSLAVERGPDACAERLADIDADGDGDSHAYRDTLTHSIAHADAERSGPTHDRAGAARARGSGSRDIP